MRVTVVGAGKMGLPLACQFAHQGATVTACDVNAALVDIINRGEAPFDEPLLAERLRETVAAGRLRASTDTERSVAESEVVVVIVPALLTAARDVDASILQQVAAQIARALRPGTMVSFETTLPVGGTRRLLLPVLEQGGLRAGVDFDLVFSPERVKSQSVFRHLTINPKVVGGITPAAAARASAFYAQYLGAPVNNVGTLEAAEMVKLAGMVYRDVNIALANELGRYSEAVGLDLGALREAINSDGEAALLQPGIGVGGHCTPLYPYFLIQDAERRSVTTVLAERARAINDQQAAHAVAQLERAWTSVAGRRVMILGLAFRPQVKEDMLSTAYLLREALQARGADVSLADPLFSDDEIRRRGFVPGSWDGDAAPEVLVLQAAHDAYRTLDFSRLASRGVKAILDGRNLWDPAAVRAAGLVYVGIGRPLHSGSPASSQPPQPAAIPLARPRLGNDEAEAAARVVRSGWVLQGPEVAAFEREFAAFTGAPHAAAVSSGTAALHLTLRAAGVGPGDEVVTVSHSFIATANSIGLCGARPVFVDIDETLNLDPARLEAAIGPRTRAILAVHQLGMPCDLAAILAIADKHELPVIEDAACAIGSEIRWQDRGEDRDWERIGRPRGLAACFSFHPRKLLTTGDGGMIVTRDPELDARVRLLRQHGMASSQAPATVLAFNYRLTDLQAAVGRRQLARLPDLLAERQHQVARYRELLAGSAVTLPVQPAWARSNWQSFCVLLPEATDSAAVIKRLLEQGISAGPAVMNAHQEPVWRDVNLHLPRSEHVRARGLVLPLYPSLSEDDQTRVVRALREALTR